MKLHALQQVIHQVLRGDAGVPSGATALGVDPQRLAIYRRFVRGHVRTALEGEFPNLRAWLGGDRWEALYEAYYTACPPTAPTLPEAAAAFPEFLEAQQQAGAFGLTPAHLALADMEWALYEVSVGGAAWPAPGELDGLVVNPTLSILSFEYDVASLALELSAGEAVEPPEVSPTMVLVFQRPPRRHACWYRGTPELLFALKVVHEGLSEAAAAEATGQPLEVVRLALSQAVEAGVLIAPEG